MKVAKAKTIEIVSDKSVQVTAVSATGGAAVLGAGGAATGLVAGGTVGAAVGLVPALFTFGLSIPIGAAIGAGCGVVAGTAVGSTAGFVGGGVAGYSAHKHKAGIRSSVGAAVTRVSSYSQLLQQKATTSAGRQGSETPHHAGLRNPPPRSLPILCTCSPRESQFSTQSSNGSV